MTSEKKTELGCIKQIAITKLFGLYDYRIPQDRHSEYDRLIILYGDNGAGKTTLLRLVFSLLYPLPSGGNKTFVAQTPFDELTITFSSGAVIRAKKMGPTLTGAFNYFIRTEKREQNFHVSVEDGGVKGELKDLFAALQSFDVPLYLLPDDRRVKSTQASSRSHGRRRILRSNEEIIFSTLGGIEDNEEPAEESHHLQVKPVLSEFFSWTRRNIVQGSTLGEESTASIYLQVINQLSHVGYTADEVGKSSYEELIGRIAALADRTKHFSVFGISPPFPGERFIEAIRSTQQYSRQAVASVLEPYLSGVEARLNALDSIRSLISTYVEMTNSFLNGKRIQFSIQEGVRFYSSKGPIQPDWLSSGERQLVLLLTHTMLARDSGGIFFIDEPELSLNIKWQRRLIEALLRCAEGSKIQYILASHSVELISQYVSNAVQLRSVS